MKNLLPIFLVLAIIGEARAQTKVVGALPDSYKYDLSRLLKTKNKDIKDKEKRKEIKQLKKELKKELRITDKYQDLVSDSIAWVSAIKNNPAFQQKFNDYQGKVIHQSNFQKIKALKLTEVVKADSIDYKKMTKDVSRSALEQVEVRGEMGDYKSDVTEILQRDSLNLRDGKKVAGRLIEKISMNGELKSDTKHVLQDSISADALIEESAFIKETFSKEFDKLQEMEKLENEMKDFRYLGKEKQQQPFLKGQDYMKNLRQFKNSDQLPQDIQKTYVDFFDQHAEPLEKAKETIQKAKKVDSPKKVLRSLLKQDTSAISNKTFKERTQLSGFAQISSMQPLLIDVMPNLGYRVTGKLTVGFGGQYRFAITEPRENAPIKRQTHQYTFQGYTDYKLFLSFYLRAEYNRIHLKQKDGYYRGENALLMGLGRDFNYKNQLTGSIHLMFYLIKPDNFQANPIAVRFGFKL